MNISIMKFGGSSLQSETKIQTVIKVIQAKLKENHKVLVIVSAMGRLHDPYATDTLLHLLKHKVSKREQDRLLSVGETISSIVLSDRLQEFIASVYATGQEESGLISDEHYSNASIIALQDQTIRALFDKYDVLVVPGFQAHTKNHHITTLGRGGSDYSTIVYAKMLQQKEVHIFTDVDGIYDKDPHSNQDANKLSRIYIDDMITLVKEGAKVMHLKSLYYAKQHGIRIYVASPSAPLTGTWIECRQ